MQTDWRGRVGRHTLESFLEVAYWIAQQPDRRLVFDSGCGTGESTLLIASRHPDCLVIGIDQSAKRLARTGALQFPHREGDVIWVRAELAGFWRLAVRSGWKLAHHYLLYPNPWPKPSQLRRRWHGHPVFPAMLRLGGTLEMRCNWKIYADEFAEAAGWITGQAVESEDLKPDGITTPFERKYRNSGLALFRVKVNPAMPGPVNAD